MQRKIQKKLKIKMIKKSDKIFKKYLNKTLWLGKFLVLPLRTVT